jgi:hypothetical protein
VLPWSAKDTGRSVVSLSFADEKDKNFSIVSLNLNTNASQSLEVVLDEDSDVTFLVHGKNPVHLSGFYHNDNPGGIYFEFLLYCMVTHEFYPPSDLYDDDEDIDSDEVGDDELEGLDSDDSVDEDIDAETMDKVRAMVDQKNKRKALQNGEEANKKPKTNAPQQPQQNKSTPNKPQQ